MKKLLLTSTLLFTSIACMKDYRKEMVAKQKKELSTAQNRISTMITSFVKTDIITKSEQLITSANNALVGKKVSNENKSEFEKAVKNLNYCKKKLEDKIENAHEDLELSKNPNNGLKLLGSIYILAKHEKTQNKVIEILDEISKNIEFILKVNKEKKFLDNTEMLGFQKLIPKCKGLISNLSSINKDNSENDIKIASWISQMEQFRVLKDNMSVEIEDNLRESMGSIIEKARVAIEKRNFIELDKLKEKEALPILEKLLSAFNSKSKFRELTDQEKTVLIEIGKSLGKPEPIMIGKTTSIADEYINLRNLVQKANLEDMEEWKNFEKKYDFVINVKAEISSFEDATKFENNFREALKLDLEGLFNPLKEKIIEVKDLETQKNLLRKLDYLKIKLEDMRRKLTAEKTN